MMEALFVIESFSYKSLVCAVGRCECRISENRKPEIRQIGKIGNLKIDQMENLKIEHRRIGKSEIVTFGKVEI